MQFHKTVWFRGCLVLLLTLTAVNAAPAETDEVTEKIEQEPQQEVILEPRSSQDDVELAPENQQEDVLLGPESETKLTSNELKDLFSRAAERLASGQVAFEQRLQQEAAQIPNPGPYQPNPVFRRLVNGAAQRLTDPRLYSKNDAASKRFWGHKQEDSRARNAVLNAMWRALKSAAGGALAVGGTLARNGGAILQAKGRLMAATGPLVVALGKQVAEDALHPPHYRDSGPSHEELHAAADAALAQRQHAKFVFHDLYEPFYESTSQLGSALRVAASGTARALGDLVSELFGSAKRAYLLKE
ncbi:hypothetical protein B566_EDAN006187 [Ephemera danica]|nr:hypothetical protein B566_EDAN006187 [Ephemera danica]